MKLAPVYDCGSCLYPQADEAIMRATLDGKKINYFDFISSLELEGCNEALRRIVPRIHMEQIEKLVNETPFITDLQKQFYKTMLWERKTRILDYSLQLL